MVSKDANDAVGFCVRGLCRSPIEQRRGGKGAGDAMQSVIHENKMEKILQGIHHYVITYRCGSRQTQGAEGLLDERGCVGHGEEVQRVAGNRTTWAACMGR